MWMLLKYIYEEEAADTWENVNQEQARQSWPYPVFHCLEKQNNFIQGKTVICWTEIELNSIWFHKQSLLQ